MIDEISKRLRATDSARLRFSDARLRNKSSRLRVGFFVSARLRGSLNRLRAWLAAASV